MNKEEIAIFWFRRDLRLTDNAGLYHALKSGLPVLPVFIFDTHILNDLEDRNDKRVDFIHQSVTQLKDELNEYGSDLVVLHDTPLKAWGQLLQQYKIAGVYTNTDYEPYARERDELVKNLLGAHNIRFNTYKDQCIFDYTEVLKDDGTPYTVFTPYSKKWKQNLNDFFLKPYSTKKYAKNFYRAPQKSELITLKELGFEKTNEAFPSQTIKQGLIKNYSKTRDIPFIHGTSRLGIHFRFGTISIRQKASKAKELSETFLNELIWRDFYMAILAWFPYVANYSFRKEYDKINWLNDEQQFKQWREGKTGYPLVDAGMRELNATGFMHNRVRMVTASFLTKHLLIDWRWGEAYFAKKLLDYDLSANNGGWQWAAGCGTDAAPYFRVFNPALQAQKFDKENKYIKHWVPEFGTDKYMKPIVDHDFARRRCLEIYKKALAK